MQNRSGTPIWYELITEDPDAAEAFYGSVLGWTCARQSGGMELDYRVFSAHEAGGGGGAGGGGDGESVAGLLRTPDEAKGMPTSWFVYFGVEDVDATTDQARSLGARVGIEPTDIPGVGRFAFLSDPQGANFYVMRGESDAESSAFAPEKSGHCSWNELVTTDQTAALDFYGALFGWQKQGSMPMGEMGDYTFIGLGTDTGRDADTGRGADMGRGADTIGAMMNGPDKSRAPFWNFAFTVSDIDAAKRAVEEGGGTITSGPMELPGDQGDWLILVDDPQGAKVMFTGKRA